MIKFKKWYLKKGIQFISIWGHLNIILFIILLPLWIMLCIIAFILDDIELILRIILFGFKDTYEYYKVSIKSFKEIPKDKFEEIILGKESI